MSQDDFDRAAMTGLLVFAASVGLLTLAGLVLALTQLAASTATAISTAGPAGIGITIAIKKGK